MATDHVGVSSAGRSTERIAVVRAAVVAAPAGGVTAIMNPASAANAAGLSPFDRTVPVISRYRWFRSGHPFASSPGGTHPHDFPGEARTLSGPSSRAGTRTRPADLRVVRPADESPVDAS